MVKNILFGLLVIVALVGCNNDDDDDSKKTFLENYEGVFWYWQDEKHLDKQEGLRFYNDSTKIIQYFSLTYPSADCWYMHSLNMINNTDGVDYIITENSLDKFTIKSIDHENSDWLHYYEYKVIGKNSDSLQMTRKSGNHVYYVRSKINPENLKYCSH